LKTGWGFESLRIKKKKQPFKALILDISSLITLRLTEVIKDSRIENF
jgi:hypothetical protein